MKMRPDLASALIACAVLAASCKPGQQCVGGACVEPAVCDPGRASAQFIGQQPPPALVTPWHQVAVSVTFANCSGQSWTPEEFSIRPADSLSLTTWGAARVGLPLVVPNGYAITLPFTVTPPQASGVYPFSWRVEHEGTERFEEPSTPVMITVAPPSDCEAVGPPARFRVQVPPPDFVATGSSVSASVTFSNCSPDTWQAGTGYSLGAQGDPAWSPTSIALPYDVPPAHDVTIPITVTAPTTPGRYALAWQLQKSGAWLSEPSPAVTPTVLDAVECGADGTAARFLSESAPADLDPGQAFDASERFGNCSGATWTQADYTLDSALPGRARTFTDGPIALPLSVGSGFAIDIPFSGHAPGAPGSYAWGFGIYTPDGALLDQPSPARSVFVRCLAACGDHDCGGDGCGGSCGDCPGGWSCDGAHCQEPPELSCGDVQWWNRSINYAYIASDGWYDTDLNVHSSTPVVLRHDSRLEHTGVYGWGYMPEFTDLTTGKRFRMLHLRPQHQNATNVGATYPTGFLVGLSGGDTADTGYPVYSTGAHLCIQSIDPYRSVFPAGQDACH